jgi:hypothetical protein
LSSYTLPDFIRKLPGREPLSEIAIVVSGSRNSMANIRFDIDLTTIRYYEQVTIGKKKPLEKLRESLTHASNEIIPEA